MKIFFVGLQKVPYANRACDIRLDSFADLFVKCGCSVTVLNRYSAQKDIFDEIKRRRYEVVELIKHKRISALSSILYLFSVVKEFFYLIGYRLKGDKNAVLHIYSGHYFDMLFYWFIARLCDYRVIYQYVEYRLDEKRKNPYHRVNAWFVDKCGAKLWDGVIPISHFLKDRALEQNPNLKWMMGPPICDYAQFDRYRTKKKNLVLYCGSAGYFEVIKLVVDSFDTSRLSESNRLELIISGTKSQIQKVKDYAPSAIVKTGLPYIELIKAYNEAKVLLIPLRNSVKDISRFPNKICEYAASKSVIVTTQYGEPAYFFKDKVSAILSDDCSVNSVAYSLNWIAEHEDQIEEIGKAGYEVGLQYFELNSYKEKIMDFLKSIQ